MLQRLCYICESVWKDTGFDAKRHIDREFVDSHQPERSERLIDDNAKNQKVKSSENSKSDTKRLISRKVAPPIHQEDSRRKISHATKNQTARNPKSTEGEAERHIGLKFADPIEPKDSERLRGDTAENQTKRNPKDPKCDTKQLKGCKFEAAPHSRVLKRAISLDSKMESHAHANSEMGFHLQANSEMGFQAQADSKMGFHSQADSEMGSHPQANSEMGFQNRGNDQEPLQQPRVWIRRWPSKRIGRQRRHRTRNRKRATENRTVEYVEHSFLLLNSSHNTGEQRQDRFTEKPEQGYRDGLLKKQATRTS